MSFEILVYVLLLGLVGLLGLPHLLIVWIKGFLALRRNVPYRYGLYDGGLLWAGRTTSAKKAMGWSLAGWSCLMGFAGFICYSRYAGWMNGSCQDILPEKTLQAAATKGVSVAYAETPFQCTVEGRGYVQSVSFKAAASVHTLDEHARAVVDLYGDAEAEAARSPSGALFDPMSGRLAHGRTKIESLTPSTRLVELDRELVVIHAKGDVHGELRLAKTSFDRAGALTLANVLKKNEAAMTRYSANPGRVPGAESSDGAKKAGASPPSSADFEPLGPRVDLFNTR